MMIQVWMAPKFYQINCVMLVFLNSLTAPSPPNRLTRLFTGIFFDYLVLTDGYGFWVWGSPPFNRSTTITYQLTSIKFFCSYILFFIFRFCFCCFDENVFSSLLGGRSEDDSGVCNGNFKLVVSWLKDVLNDRSDWNVNEQATKNGLNSRLPNFTQFLWWFIVKRSLRGTSGHRYVRTIGTILLLHYYNL